MKEVPVALGDGIQTPAFLAIPAAARGLVLFAHGSGSGRASPRNLFVANRLNTEGLGTLLFDLLTPREDELDRATAQLRFDIDLLARRLHAATRWVATQPAIAGLRLGYFGASTGAAAALVAAAVDPAPISAVVSRGGRPDLAGERLRDVRAPTLLIVGGADRTVIELNRQASMLLTAPRELVIIPGAGHLFEEPGALAEVARLSGDWFARAGM